MKYGNLNFLEPSGPLQACNRTTLPLLSVLCIFSLVNGLVQTFPLDFSTEVVSLMPNPQPGQPGFDFGVHSPREVSKLQRSPPYHLVVGYSLFGCSYEMSGLHDPAQWLLYYQHNLQLKWGTQSSLHGLT